MAITYRLQKGSRLTVEEMDGNFQYVENYLTGLTSSVSNLVSAVAGITASEAVQNTVVIAGLTASVLTLTSGLASATASIGTLTTGLASATASIGTLTTGLASATASIGTLTTGLASATASIGDLTMDLASATASIGDLALDLASATASIGGLTTGLASATASIGDLAMDLASATASLQYSTTETIVGSWIDNKPIYRRVYEVTATGGSYSMTGLETSINLKSFIDFRVLVKSTFGSGNYETSKETSIPAINQIMVIPITNASSTPSFSVRCYNNNLSTPLQLDLAIILEYTKTTD